MNRRWMMWPAACGAVLKAVVGAAAVQPSADPPPGDVVPAAVVGELRSLKALDGDPEDMGVVRSGATVTRRIRFENTAESPVELEVVATTCGCLSAEFVPAVVQPGGIATLSMHVHAAPTLGEQAQYVTFRATCEGPEGPRSERGVCGVRFTADVAFEVHPSWFALSAVEGEPVEVSVALRQLRERWEQVRILGAQSSSPALAPAGTFVPADGPSVRVVKFAGAAPQPGHHSGSLVVRTDAPGTREILIPYSMRVVEPWRTRPGGAMFTAASRGIDLELEARIERWAGAAPSRAALADAAAPVDVDLKATGPGSATVRLRLREGVDAPFATRLNVYADDGQLLASAPEAFYVPRQGEE